MVLTCSMLVFALVLTRGWLHLSTSAVGTEEIIGLICSDPMSTVTSCFSLLM